MGSQAKKTTDDGLREQYEGRRLGATTELDTDEWDDSSSDGGEGIADSDFGVTTRENDDDLLENSTADTEGTSESDPAPALRRRQPPVSYGGLGSAGSYGPYRKPTQRSSYRQFSAGQPITSSSLRDHRALISSAPGSRRVSNYSMRSSNSTYYPMLLESTPAFLLPAEPEGRADSLPRHPPRSSPLSGSSYPQSLISQSSRDSHQSLSAASKLDGTSSPLDSVLANVPDDDPYVLQVMNLSTQHYREKQTERDPVKGSPHTVATLPTDASRRTTSSTTPDSVPLLAGQADITLASVERKPSDVNRPVEDAPETNFQASQQTLYRSSRCKQYFETRYSHICLLTSSPNLRYNPLEVIRWRRAMWQRAVKSGASTEEQKKWKLRYYTWHVGNTELVEYYNEHKEDNKDQEGSNMANDLSRAHTDIDDVLADNEKRPSKWKKARKRRRPTKGEWQNSLRVSDRRFSRRSKAISRSLVSPPDGTAPEESNQGQALSVEAADDATREVPRPMFDVDGTIIVSPSFLTQFLAGGSAGLEPGAFSRLESAQELSDDGKLVYASGPSASQAQQAVSPSEISENPFEELQQTSVTAPALSQGVPKVSMETNISSGSPQMMDLDQSEDAEEIVPVPDGQAKRKKSGFWGRILEKRAPEDSSTSVVSGENGNISQVPGRKKSFLSAVSMDHLGHKKGKSPFVTPANIPRVSAESQRSITKSSTLSSTRDGMDILRKPRTPSPFKKFPRMAHAESEPVLVKGGRSGARRRSPFPGDGDDEGLRVSHRQDVDRGIGQIQVANNVDMPEHPISEPGSHPEDHGYGHQEAAQACPSQNRESVLDDSMASDTDDGDPRGRVRGIKGMMKTIGLRQRKDIAAQGDENVQSDGDTGMAAAGWDDGDAVRKKARYFKAKLTRDQSKRWVWDDSSSEDSSENAVSATRGRSRDQWWSRRKMKGKKASAGDIASKTGSRIQLGDSQEATKKPRRRKKLMRTFIGSRLGYESSTSATSSVADQDGIDGMDGSARVDVVEEGGTIKRLAGWIVTSATSGEEDDEVGPVSGSKSLSSSKGRSPSQRGEAISTFDRGDQTYPRRDIDSPLTAEEHDLHDRLLMLGGRLDKMMPSVERYKVDIEHQIDQHKTLMLRLALPEPAQNVSDALENEKDKNASTVQTGADEEGQTPSSLPLIQTVEVTGVKLTEEKIRQAMEKVTDSLTTLEDLCLALTTRDNQSHEHVSAMMCGLDAVNQQVNEELSRQLKIVEEALQQAEGRPRALGFFQELYYQLIAYLLAFLGFTIWSWFQLWKVGRRALSGAKTIVAVISPPAAAAVEDAGQATLDIVKQGTVKALASATGGLQSPS
ncbi:uncharacterized protein SPPG_03293 [Spizellomyces punctatus DAOM BR117]|uniref:Uncharacterized protein n=1 Tax=Spizellomyces punctatus (strain DAOM BR117) TaxID=645134 RepID=A0A0L0HKD2_SPIPD|nr:uncharacterized protein SPPG_03293 [Spizellomyces punctatus DAOM BR117]KND01493.1 hypothetical protein SPPG_03293 [Spizellomyces punctatus DAOM BR117]|eukprot:XP_016609532.1 hypothetical protein SPPG_03293 [Spizellomyces punctatus DAOM BR117]